MTAAAGGILRMRPVGCRRSGVSVKILLVVVAWCLLFVFEALFALVKAALFLPARLLGYRERPSARTR